MNNILLINNLNKSYHSIKGETKVLNGVSFSIKKNEFLSIVGPSGCGKSTILNILTGLDKDYKGTIVKDENLVISYMSQEDSLFPWLSVLDNTLIGLKVKNMLTKDNISYVNNLLNKYGLKDFKNTKINSLSGGMKQRVALIRTLAIKPNLIILDEPFSALDYVTRLKVSNDVHSIIKSENITALMVTHDISEAIRLSDRIIVLSKRPSTIKNIYESNGKDYDNIWKDIDDNE